MSQFIIDLERYRYLSQNRKDLMEKDNEAYREFLHYGALLSCHVVYQRKEKFLRLIKNYLTDKMGIGDFEYLFFQRWKKTNEDSDNFEKELLESDLASLEYDPKCEAFTELINLVFYENESLSDENYNLTEESFQNNIQRLYTDLQKLLND